VIIYLKGLNLLQQSPLLYKDAGNINIKKIHKDSEVLFSKCQEEIRPYQQLTLLFLLPAMSQYPINMFSPHQY
jgi:hypothetical protein